MKLLGLPGRKQSTFADMDGLVRLISLGQTEIDVRRYGFWGAADVADPELDQEIGHAAASGADFVVAKSIGTLVTMLAASEHGLAPSACVFIGTPLRRLEATGLTGLLQTHCAAHRTLLIQQTSDFNGDYASLAALVGGGARCIEIPGDDHLYSDLRLLAGLIEDWARARP